MKRKRFGALLLALTLTLSLIAPGTCPTVHAMTVLETDTSTASDGCTMLGIYGSYYSNAKEALDKINDIRKEACTAGNVPDPRNPERMLTPSDYSPLKWSSDLERVARIRAAEAGIAYHFMDSGHQRLNQKEISDIVYNGHHSSAEDLSYYYNKDMIEGILLWYMEKRDWVNQDYSKTTGHYTSIINPNHTYIGLGGFYTEATQYPATLAGELSATSEQGLDETMLSAPKDVMQKIEVSDDFIKNNLLDGTTTIETDQTTTLTPMVQIQRKSTRKLWMPGTFTYSSSNTAVAKVANTGVVTGVTDGTATITVRSGNHVIASTEVTVKCAHPLKMTSSTPSTCQRAGERVYYCSVCNKTTKQTLPLAAHDYVYGTADSSGKCTGVCSVCHHTVTITPPTSFSLLWVNESFGYAEYSDDFPKYNPIPSTIECYISGVKGDENYCDMVIESSDESVLLPPDQVYPNAPLNPIQVKKPGIATLSIYPKYNPRIKKTFIVRVGDAGSVDIALADVTLSPNSYTYSGKSCTPAVNVSYYGTPLTQGTDYTVSYENNIAAGTAVVTVSGKGIFKGSIQKNFTIKSASTNAHTHQAVKTPAVAATCTTPGHTESSYCSVCGAVIKSQTSLPAKGHNYINGKCSNCGDYLYLDASGLRYTINDDLSGGYTVSVSAVPKTTLRGEITIPSKVTIGKTSYTVTIIGKDAFADQKNLTSVILPPTITNIKSGAFSNCSSLKSVTFQSTTAPSVDTNAWTGTDTSAVTLIIPELGTGYRNIIVPLSGVNVKKTPHVHSLQKHKKVSPTCEKSGHVEYYTCSICNRVYLDSSATAEILYNDTILYPVGHDWDEGKYETRTRFVITCKRCKARKVYNVEDNPADPPRPSSPTVNKKLVLNTSAGLKWVRNNTIDKYVKPELNKAVKSTYNSNTISWNKVKGAKGYQIYACKCDHKKNKTKLTLLATVKSNKTSYKIKNLKKNTFYEYKVVAYRKVDGKKVAIGKSLELHAVTASKSYKYSNPTSIKVKQKNKVVSSISVKVKKTAQLKSSPVMPKGKKLKGHTAKIRYISSKSSIASVNQKGKITGKKKGTCYVYAVGQNGITKKIKVKVK